MDDLISREALTEAMNALRGVGGIYLWDPEEVLATIEKAPSAVVRCEECIHSIWDEENEMWKCVESAEYDSEFGDYIGFTFYHNADYFCAHGEGRTDYGK